MELKNLIRAKLIKRYKRFLMKVKFKNQTITAYTPNTGTMKTLLDEENFVYLENSQNLKRKLKYTTKIIELVKKEKNNQKFFTMIDTHLANRIVEEWIKNKEIPELKKYQKIEREVKYGKNQKSRIDILLSHKNKKKTFIEIKNATLKLEKNTIAFPDAITERGKKHLEELILEIEQGNQAIVFFLVSRNDGKKFRVAKEIDEKFYETFLKAKKKGVQFLAYQIDFELKEKEGKYNFQLTRGPKIKII